MPKQVLITGGAGFIGSHVADHLLQRGHRVRVLDNLLAQVHGPERQRPGYLDSEVELQVGDVRDRAAVRRALEGVDAVFHLAARVGIGQSMYQIADYADHNVSGTAVLMEAIIGHPVERLVIASSKSIYGEGLYRDRHHQLVSTAHRTEEQLRHSQWELRDADGAPLQPVPTPESKTPALASIYALSKYNQEVMSLVTARAYNIPVVALRFFNVYGERQALSNPYTGVLAIFASRLLNKSPPLIYEDGWQRRDFVSVHDVAQACLLAMEQPAAVGEVFNIGSGTAVTVGAIATRMAQALNAELLAEITGTYRVGDIRHCFADISKAQRLLGYAPTVALDDGIAQLSQWLATQSADDRAHQAAEELKRRGLAR